MRFHKRLAASAVLILGAAIPQQAQAQAAKSLYARLGGYDALAAVTDDFLGRLATDPTLGKFFAGHGKESSKRIRQLVVDQLCAVTGGPCFYVGRDMRSVHQGMNITEADWDRSIGHLKATLGAFKVPAAEQGEVLGALGGLKVDIVEMKH